MAPLQAAQVPQLPPQPVLGALAHAATGEHHQVGLLGGRRRLVPMLVQQVGDAL